MVSKRLTVLSTRSASVMHEKGFRFVPQLEAFGSFSGHEQRAALSSSTYRVFAHIDTGRLQEMATTTHRVQGFHPVPRCNTRWGIMFRGGEPTSAGPVSVRTRL